MREIIEEQFYKISEVDRQLEFCNKLVDLFQEILGKIPTKLEMYIFMKHLPQEKKELVLQSLDEFFHLAV